ncbi:MAG TPA: TetR/AcrR family transcriptional regulator [Nevskiaceae bacterium]|nr:TetR/AcrR family transcriptional regulator [Nevskiaceae bacterium]
MAAKRQAKETKKRAYLAKDDRRKALLETAARVVEEQGWSALSMISVAEQAKVSRQLVYAHFASADELMTETMAQIFRDAYDNARDSIQRSSANIVALIEQIEKSTFDMPPGRVRALWQMITATYSDSAETARLSRRLRHLLTNMWAPVANEAFGLEAREGRALIWMLHMAFWGAHQLVDEGEVDRATATRLVSWMVTQIQAGSVMSPLPRAGKNGN